MGSGYLRLLMAEQARGRVFVEPGWLPPNDECPELAGLREEHERLLRVMSEKLSALNDLMRAVDDVEKQRFDAVRDAILAGDKEADVEFDVPSADEITRARNDYDAATEALDVWVRGTLRTIANAAQAVESRLAERLAAAEAKRAEAVRLLEDATQLAARPMRLQAWFDRYVDVTDPSSGETRKVSALGPIAFDALAVPLKTPIPDLIREIAGLIPGSDGSDDISHSSNGEVVISA
jgi:hypothetical protein